MNAFTIHSYTTDNTEAVVITEKDLSEEEVPGLWWNKMKEDKNFLTPQWADLSNIFAIKRDILQL